MHLPYSCSCCSPAPGLTRRRLLLGAAGAGALLAGCAATGGGVAPAGNSYVLRGGHVISMDPAVGDIAGADVLVQGGRIAAIGTGLAVGDAQVVDARGMIVMPGFVETHWHMWNSLLKNMLRPGVEYFGLKAGLIEHHRPLDYYRANRLAIVEAINAGFTTVNNFAHNTRTPAHVDAELQALAETGIRARYSYGYIDPMPAEQTMPLADLRRVKAQWFGTASPFGDRVDLGVALRGDQGSTREVFRQELQVARELGLPKVMHIGQSRRFRVNVAELVRLGFIDQQTLLVHGMAATPEDRAAMASLGLSLSVSPQSELRLAGDGDYREQLLQMLAAKINVCFSIDATSLGTVSPFDAMNTTWSLGIPWTQTPSEKLPRVDFDQCLQMATINGARALGLQDRIGSLAPGKQADIVLVRTTDLNMSPLGEPRSAVVRSATPANVDTVIVGGRFLKRGGRLIGVDPAQVMADAEDSLRAMRLRAGGAWAPKA
ncbi:amidohydrolase family protein [Pseudacidovorax intermedius]|uniref:amidohydrolase family protein n=1 Tax=Pseudacidovorax intermedius TaxID=433924 RepID=UPI0026F0AF72|nr:amidohydrolase family protein [Pseudacidovorax intermedius]